MNYLRTHGKSCESWWCPVEFSFWWWVILWVQTSKFCASSNWILRWVCGKHKFCIKRLREQTFTGEKHTIVRVRRQRRVAYVATRSIGTCEGWANENIKLAESTIVFGPMLQEWMQPRPSVTFLSPFMRMFDRGFRVCNIRIVGFNFHYCQKRTCFGVGLTKS